VVLSQTDIIALSGLSYMVKPLSNSERDPTGLQNPPNSEFTMTPGHCLSHFSHNTLLQPITTISIVHQLDACI